LGQDSLLFLDVLTNGLKVCLDLALDAFPWVSNRAFAMN